MILENLLAHDIKYGFNWEKVVNMKFCDIADYRSKYVSRRKRTVERD